MNKDFHEFDAMVRSMISKEPDFMPEACMGKIDKTLENLPENDNGLKKWQAHRPSVKIILIAAVLAVLLMTTAVAAPRIFKMAQNLIEEFSKINDVNLESKQEEYEKYNAPINYTSESGGISVTIDNIALDGNFLLITSTITCDSPVEDIVEDSWLYRKSLELRNEDKSKEILEQFKDSPNYEQNLENLNNLDYKQFLFAMSPDYSFKIDGVDYGRLDKADWEEYIENDNTFVTVQKYIIPFEVPDVFNLSISAENICNIEGNWGFDLVIDKSEVSADSVAVTPEIQSEVTSIVSGEEYKHHITIEKLSISPFGGQITLSEKGAEVFRDFTLRDKDNNYYMVLNDTVISSEDISRNTFEFIYPWENNDIDELELVPILTYGAPVKKTVMFGKNIESTDIKISDIGGYKVQSVYLDNSEIKITLKPYGVILHYRSIINGAFCILGKDGKEGTNMNISLQGPEYDKNNGNAIVTIHCNGFEPAQVLNEIGGFRYVEMPNMKLNENEAIKIPLK